MDTPFLGLHPRIIPTGIASLFRRDDTPTQRDRSPSRPASTPTTPRCQSEADTPQVRGVSLAPPAPALGQPSPAPERSHEPSASKTDSRPSPSPILSAGVGVASALAPPPGLAVSALDEPGLRPRTPSDPPPPYPHPEPEPSDPTFDPPFHNDVLLRERSRLTSLAHFAQKHFSEGIVSAAGRHVLSHMEYAACLADYRELHARYADMRALEEVDPLKGIEAWGAEVTEGPSFRARAVRVRFVNYYTAATGRPKKEKVAQGSGGGSEQADAPTGADEGPEGAPTASTASHDYLPPPDQTASHNGVSAASITPHDPRPSTAHPDASPSQPPAPPKASSGRKEAFQSAYDQAFKASRRKLLKTGLKLLEKRSSSSSSSSSRADVSPPLYLSSQPTTAEQQRPQSTSTEPMPARMRKFCATPKTGSGVDETWVAVPMRDIDEVDAHISMFLGDRKHYGELVVDVGGRIVEWVKGDELRRAAEAAVR